jgi:arylsulfatase A-like enzyme
VDDRPNIVLISTDQWHAGAFSFLGNPHVKTPHSDRIAAESVWFDSSYAADPVCGPSRSSWITGRMPIEHGVIGNRARMIRSIPDWGQWFRRHDYEVVHFGKWDSPGRDPRLSNDLYVGTFPAGQHVDQSVASLAGSYLLSRDRTKPMFLHVSLMNPHDICQVSCMRTNAGRLPVDLDELPPLPANFHARPDEPMTLVNRVRKSYRRSASFGWDEDDWRLYIWQYYRYCELADLAIGRVLDAIDASGLRENTLLVYTSDHGEGLGHHGMFTKAYLYESSARVPLALSWPGRLPAGERNRSILTSGVDLFPTFCAAAGIPAPPDLCGHDLLGQYTRGVGRETLVTSATFGAYMARRGNDKLITYPDDPTVQFFNLEADPDETRNLAGEHPERVASLRASIETFASTLKPAGGDVIEQD